jgi:hypothetical protein
MADDDTETDGPSPWEVAMQDAELRAVGVELAKQVAVTLVVACRVVQAVAARLLDRSAADQGPGAD